MREAPAASSGVPGWLGGVAEGVALLLARIVVAHAFWVSGQTKVDGITVPLDLKLVDLTFTIPTSIKPATYYLFETEYSAVPLPPAIGAVMSSVAETLLPIALVIGLAARLAALGLLMMTMVIQIYVFPDAWWTVHGYWAALLLIVIVRGPGIISVDRMIWRRVTENRRAPGLSEQARA